jgi:hypothetical protein
LHSQTEQENRIDKIRGPGDQKIIQVGLEYFHGKIPEAEINTHGRRYAAFYCDAPVS